MKNKKLLFLILVLVVSGCERRIETILEKTQTPNSGYIFICNPLSIKDEWDVFKKLQDTLSLISPENTELIRQIKQRTENSKMMIDCYAVASSKENEVMAAKSPTKPPNPCPTPFDAPNLDSTKYVCFFTRDPQSAAEFYKNNELVKRVEKGKYDELTKIRIIRVPARLNPRQGDTLVVKMFVTYLDSMGTLNSDVIEYKEIIRERK